MYFSEQFSPLDENMMTGGFWFANIHCSGPITKTITWQFTNKVIPFGSNEQTLWNVFDLFVGYL